MDRSSTVWLIDHVRIVFAWNYDICKKPTFYGIPDPTGKNTYACEGEDITCDDDDYAIGFKLAYSDAVHPTLTVEKLREIFPPESESDDPTPTPSAGPSTEPSPKPEPSADPQPSPVPQVSPSPKPSLSSPTKKPKDKKDKISVKGKSLYKGKKRLCKYEISNKKLVFKVAGKKLLYALASKRQNI